MIKFHAVLRMLKKLPTKYEANTTSLITMTPDNYLTKMKKIMSIKINKSFFSVISVLHLKDTIFLRNTQKLCFSQLTVPASYIQTLDLGITYAFKGYYRWQTDSRFCVYEI